MRDMKKQIITLAACALLALGFTTETAAGTAAAQAVAPAALAADTAGIDAYSDTTDTAVAVIPQGATYSVSMDSDSMEEVARRMMGFTGEAAIAIVAILVIFFLAIIRAKALPLPIAIEHYPLLSIEPLCAVISLKILQGYPHKRSHGTEILALYRCGEDIAACAKHAHRIRKSHDGER